jgi:hypothetical protein
VVLKKIITNKKYEKYRIMYCKFTKLSPTSIGCSFKFFLKVGVEESIVNAPRIMDHGSCLNLTSLFVVVCVFTLPTDEWCVHNRLFNANFEEKFK